MILPTSYLNTPNLQLRLDTRQTSAEMNHVDFTLISV